MAVPAGPTEIRYVGNGVTTVFAVPFLVIQAADLAVYLDGVRLSSGYIQSGVGNPTSSVVFSVAPASLAQILFALEVPFERLNDYQENGDLLSSTVNRDFDRIWQALKQLLRFSTRSLTLGQFDVDGQGWYRAKGNGIRDLHDPVNDQDAATKKSVELYVSEVIASSSGPVGQASQILYVAPDTTIKNLQQLSDLSSPNNGAAMIGRATSSVFSVSELLLYPGGYNNQVVYLVGYYASTPGVGGGYLIWKSSSTKVADNGKVFAVSGVASGRWERPVEPQCPTNYGAYGDGVMDDSNAFEECARNNSVVSSKSKYVFRITRTITINSQPQIIDLAMASIHLDDATGSLTHILVGGNMALRRTGVTLRDAVFTREQIATAGAALHLKNTGVITITGLRIYGDNKIFNGIVNENGIINNIKENYIDNCRNFQTYHFGSGTGANRTVDTTMTGNRLEGGVNAIRIGDYVEGFFLKDDIIFNTAAHGMVADASSDAAGLFSFKMQQTDFDTCGNTCLYIDKISNFQITGAWFSNGGASVSTTSSINIASLCSSGILASNQAYGRAGQPNIRIEGKDITVSGGNVINGGQDAILLGSGIADVNINGNNFAGFTRYGINAFSNPAGGWSESGNNFNLSAGGIPVGSSGANCTYGRSKGGFNTSVVFDPPAIAAGGSTAVNVTLPSAEIGDFCMWSFTSPLSGAKVLAEVTTPGQVHVEFSNPTTGTIDIASGTLRVSVIKQR